jgi:hypothetical protein
MESPEHVYTTTLWFSIQQQRSVDGNRYSQRQVKRNKNIDNSFCFTITIERERIN